MPEEKEERSLDERVIEAINFNVICFQDGVMQKGHRR
jgi:hypothetical protein